ncbi:MAG: hypothetical protein II131_00105, partial [Neisseriaceae bacterium]|nr:hypothetical protein [Neisseriaceae bacterium]
MIIFIIFFRQPLSSLRADRQALAVLPLTPVSLRDCQRQAWQSNFTHIGVVIFLLRRTAMYKTIFRQP